MMGARGARATGLVLLAAVAMLGCRKRPVTTEPPPDAQAPSVDAAAMVPQADAKGEDCDALHFGIGRAADRVRAYACFLAAEDALRVVTMNLSEDGTTTDLALARAWLAKEASFPSEHATLEQALARRAAGERVELEFCKDVAFATPNLDACEAAEARLAKEGQRVAVERTRAALPEASRAAFDRMQEAYARFERAEGARKLAEYETGTIRSLAAMGQEQYVRARHGERLAALVSGQTLGTGLDEPAEDRALNERYAAARDRFRRNLKDELAQPKAAFSPEAKAQYEHCIETLRDAQLAWIRYRDAWTALAAALEASGRSAGTKDAVSAWLTKSRTEELAYDPVAPNDAR
jgi:uncharacterized protein YecT (DUF1311 family)